MAEWDEESPELQRSDSPELPPLQPARGQAPGPGQDRGDGTIPKRRLTTQASEAAAAVLQAITVASTVPRSPVPGPVQVSAADAVLPTRLPTGGLGPGYGAPLCVVKMQAGVDSSACTAKL